MEARGLDFRPPGGESPRDVRCRVQRWLIEVAMRGDSIAAVTHKGVLRAVLAAATGWDMTCKPPVRLQDDALHRFAIDDAGTIRIVACNVSLRAAAADERRQVTVSRPDPGLRLELFRQLFERAQRLGADACCSIAHHVQRAARVFAETGAGTRRRRMRSARTGSFARTVATRGAVEDEAHFADQRIGADDRDDELAVRRSRRAPRLRLRG